MLFENYGYCYCCDSPVRFVAETANLRDNYRCVNCRSIPRERALIYCLEKFFPSWRDLVIHESSPIKRGASLKLRNCAKKYIPSQYFPEVQPGAVHDGHRCENIESLTFDDESLDLHVTQDVMEHVFSPQKAFREIARTLKPGGAHIFTVPLVNGNDPSEICARLDSSGSVFFLRKPEYHGNPVSREGALVTMRWGNDICDHIYKASGMITKIMFIDALELGIRARFIEVLIATKPANNNLLFE